MSDIVRVMSWDEEVHQHIRIRFLVQSYKIQLEEFLVKKLAKQNREENEQRLSSEKRRL